ncbi:LAMI_0C10044g1_1 [Lachancea mirantina]|uniref:rRNA methyltransferase 1, mitochondrial n=1 Tax=Lachancea mirantina TaxID=1230905 RepID=A0A1G4J5H3_9SACH|nr:LAMI_0C10044g1_1 [Lachancea mirantina]
MIHNRVVEITTRRWLARAAVKSAVKVPNQAFRADKGGIKFEKNFPSERKAKAWERAGQDKDTWFKRKYAHIHAKSNEGVPNDRYGKRDAHKVRVEAGKLELKRQHREHRNKFENRDSLINFKPNPLSEYVYGVNSVQSALMAGKREFHSRLLYHGAIPEQIAKLAKFLNVTMEVVDKHRLNLLTNYGVHNNVVLETKPLQIEEISYVGQCDEASHSFQYGEYSFDGFVDRDLSFSQSATKKYPLGIYLDQIHDPHNIGAIIRTAFFLGADFLIMSRRNCAPLSPVVAKTSSGALEYFPIFTVDKPLDFFNRSQEAGGWSFVSTGIATANKHNKHKFLQAEDLRGMLQELPVILVVGNEGEGVRTNLEMRSDFLVSIPFGGGQTDIAPVQNTGVDSLNVSVATGILLNLLLS